MFACRVVGQRLIAGYRQWRIHDLAHPPPQKPLDVVGG